jgi:tellurite methyltransferase
MNSLIGFYNAFYASDKNSFGGGKPTPLLEKLLIYVQSGIALDLGAGDGRNALYLAQKGFEVTAVDFSATAIEKIQRVAEHCHVSIHSVIADICDFEFVSEYDVIITTFTFHHLKKDEGFDMIRKMQLNTKAGGYNVITTFTQDGDFYRNDPDKRYFYPKHNELQEMYYGWEIIWYDEREVTALQKNQDGKEQFNTMAALIARKTS